MDTFAYRGGCACPVSASSARGEHEIPYAVYRRMETTIRPCPAFVPMVRQSFFSRMGMAHLDKRPRRFALSTMELLALYRRRKTSPNHDRDKEQQMRHFTDPQQTPSANLWAGCLGERVSSSGYQDRGRHWTAPYNPSTSPAGGGGCPRHLQRINRRGPSPAHD